MDHIVGLFRPDSALALPEVPYLCKPEHINIKPLSFSDYPAQLGFDKQAILFGDYSQHSVSDIASFLQTWLFFGLLEEFIGSSIEREAFLTSSTRGSFISTRKALPHYLNTWGKSKPSARRHLDRVEACVAEVRAFVPALLDGDCPLPPPAALSILILGATLEAVTVQQFPAFPIKRFSQPAKTTWGMHQLVEEWLLKAGWCVNDINRAAETLSLPTLVFAASIARKEAVLPDTHASCSVDACVARDFKDKPYHTQHVYGSSCGCSGHIGWSEEQSAQMKQILEDGAVPVVVINTTSDQPGAALSIEVLRSDQTRYIAFSHVWADGLGNQEGNSLPACQLLRLSKLASDLVSIESRGKKSFFSKFHSSKPLAIWVDTLCIPRTKPHKSLAISRMNQTYAEAAKVLILDSELYTQSFTPDQPEIILFLLLASGWARRVWTMQEGSLGSDNLYVRTADDFVNISALSRQLEKKWEKSDMVTDTVWIDASIIVQEFNWLRLAHSNSYWRDRVTAVAVALHLLNGRACTNDGDAYLCLAGMIGLPPPVVREVADTPVKERTMVLLRELRYAPRGIIFSPGRKLQVDGYRWACESFWKTQAWNDDQVAEVKAMKELNGGVGLNLEYQGFLLKPFNLNLSGQAAANHGFVFEYSAAKLQYKAVFDKSAGEITQIFAGLAYDPDKSRLGILVPERNVARRPMRVASYPAALVMLVDRKRSLLEKADPSRPIVCKYVCQITLAAATAGDVESAKSKGELGQADRPNIHMKFLGADEGVSYHSLHWCIA
ncbi:hypothetical protein A1O3_09981 [Capronia epimyces CBS 606.96]|uniref:Heterokaryon incompatibility domain-containing protein n=1 Tax=Capronia epimyces CBS 606.96 TaxID=1182542 RepID=W9XB89_9EURO|nr:uncharacterized protein A1O3_09981 [Capronia epimyces CBS 606.96]EXJ77752.1 hypothetical protein A1O3_09981 [Capronia epimyces CBS 606.96]